MLVGNRLTSPGKPVEAERRGVGDPRSESGMTVIQVVVPKVGFEPTRAFMPNGF